MSTTSFENKASVEEIRQRFDADVERFANLELGQTSTIDAPLVMKLVTEAAAAVNPQATHALDVGCGAGNYSLKLLQKRPHLNLTLIDLSQPMLNRAVARIRPQTTGTVTAVQGDIRATPLPANQFDVIMAAAVLHHLRHESEWEQVFAKLYAALKPGGSLWIADLVAHSDDHVQKIMEHKYGRYLTHLKDEAYRDHVFAYIEREDSPRPLLFQIDLLRRVGFTQVEILHKNNLFAAFGGMKS